jgi:hypothetical protein
MSGGHFWYMDLHLEQIVEQMEQDISRELPKNPDDLY